MGFCSAVTLAFATIFSLAAVALLAIAFSTDNWLTITVRKDKLDALENSRKNAEWKNLDAEDLERTLENYLRNSRPEWTLKNGQPGWKNVDIDEILKETPLMYTRTRGLFRECYPGQKSDAPTGKFLDLYMSPVETWCRNLDYYIPDEEGTTNNLDGDQMTRIHMNRAMVALFIVGFFFIVVSFIAGVRGCWKTSPSNITASAVLMLIACLFSAGGMGLWHGVEHWERSKIKTNSATELFVAGWPATLNYTTEFKYEWSYIVSWVGVGLALISSILFSLAAVCIRTDKEREDAMNMQYLMPVYHQKQQAQQPYGPYGYAAYPGPYYGSQYGPYNY